MLRDPALIPLSRQHHNALAFCVLTERSLHADRSEENVSTLARHAIDRYDLELASHFAIEESVLFPAAGEHPMVAQLISEHRTMAYLIEQIRLQPSIALLEEFCKILRKHIRSEENELFQEIQQRLPPEVLASIGKEIDAQTVRICL